MDRPSSWFLSSCLLCGLAAIARALNPDSTAALITLLLGVVFACGSLLAANPRFREQLRKGLQQRLDRLVSRKQNPETGTQRQGASDF